LDEQQGTGAGEERKRVSGRDRSTLQKERTARTGEINRLNRRSGGRFQQKKRSPAMKQKKAELKIKRGEVNKVGRQLTENNARRDGGWGKRITKGRRLVPPGGLQRELKNA